MRFTLNDIELNLTSGLLIKQGNVTKIRAKTLLVLKYLITHKEQVVTKQALLTTIWHDVVVQDQVLVQSIKEIRNLLGSDVIKTYPRQGYQWTAELVPCDEKKPHYKQPLFAFAIIAMAALFIILGTLFLPTSDIDTNGVKESQFSVSFLPIKNDMPDNIHDWVPLEGKKYLSHALTQQSDLKVIEDQALSTSATGSDYVTLANIHPNSRIDLFVQTRLLGYPQDFLLEYTLHLKHNIERGVIFSDNIQNTFDQLVQLIKQRYSNNLSDQEMTPNTVNKSDFSSEALSRGIAFYHQREYQKAIPFFRSALQDNPKLLAARRSLAASYVNSGNVKQGITLMLENIAQAKSSGAHREEIRSNLMLGVLLINWYQHPSNNNLDSEAFTNQSDHLTLASQYILVAKTLAEQHQDKLFIAYAHEELGKIKRIQQHYEQAISLQKQALTIHQSFAGKYGQTSALIELARISAAQHDFQQANSYFTQAQIIADKNGVTTNKVNILLARADIQQLQGATELANQLAQQAKQLAEQAKSDYLIAQISAWLSDNKHYEIN